MKRPRPFGPWASGLTSLLRRFCPVALTASPSSAWALPASNSISTTERRPEKVDSSFTVARSKDAWRPKASRTPSAIVPISESLRSSPARIPRRMDLTGPWFAARSGDRESESTASPALAGPCTLTVAKRPRPAVAIIFLTRSVSSRM